MYVYACTNACMYACMQHGCGLRDVGIHGCMDGYMNGWVGRWVDGWMDGWVGG